MPVVARSLFDVFAGIRGGTVLNEANRDLIALIQSVRATGKKGSITLTLTVAPDSDKSDENLLELVPDYKVKAPIPPRGKGLYYATQDGGLTKEDPRQIDAFPEDVTDISEARLAAVGRGAVVVNGD